MLYRLRPTGFFARKFAENPSHIYCSWIGFPLATKHQRLREGPRIHYKNVIIYRSKLSAVCCEIWISQKRRLSKHPFDSICAACEHDYCGIEEVSLSPVQSCESASKSLLLSFPQLYVSMADFFPLSEHSLRNAGSLYISRIFSARSCSEPWTAGCYTSLRAAGSMPRTTRTRPGPCFSTSTT